MTRVAFALLAVLAIACGDNKTVGPDAELGPVCADGLDNDGDGAIDFPDDLGCESPDSDTEDGLVMPACSDNRDNDGDGKTDFPNDPGCPAILVNTEVDNCPDGAGCPQCGDGEDNDGNGASDYPNDTGCESAADTVEFTNNAQACGAGLLIVPLPLSGMDMATLTTQSTSNLTTTCGGGGGAHAIAYRFHLTQPQVIVASTDDPLTTFNTVLDLRSEMCSTPGGEIACHDDISTSNNKSTITKSLKTGTYYLIVQGKTVGDTGTYQLKVQFFPGEGTPCFSAQDCGPGLFCRLLAGETQNQCAGPACDDDRDDDGDGKIDFPDDPGCTNLSDATETDVCPTMPTDPLCPICGNAIDDDGDIDIDYPDDVNCRAASGFNEACPQTEPVIVATGPVTSGTTTGAVNDYAPPPGSFNGHICSTTSTNIAIAPDRVIQFDIPAMTSLRLVLSPLSFDSAHVLFDSTCGGTPIECYDDPAMVVSNLAAGRYFLVIDGYSSGSGSFTLNLSGAIAGGQSCESSFAQAGAFVCAPGYVCSGAAGSRSCMPTECNDTFDNNGDGKVDFPNDPGCSSISDVVEDTVCPGPSCPVCSDGVDNDGDLAIDYPADTGCLSAVANSEVCRDNDPVLAITTPIVTGTLVGAVDDHDPSCVATNFADKVFTLDIPVQLQSLVMDTEGSAVDTVLSFLTSTCAEPSIQCDDDGGVGIGDSLITRTNVAPGVYAIVVDSDAATLDTFILNVKGTIVNGGSCESALFQSGVLRCPPNVGCNGPVGSRICQGPPQCFDGQDNNGDGKVDYPNDPGCIDQTDSIEDLVCPGASCPACADGLDNDNDGRTDFPMDARCTAASGAFEGCVDTDPIASILMPLTTGTLVGTTDDHDPSCVTTAGAELIYTLTIPDLESLRIDTNGSIVDTVLSLMTSDCMEPALACDDDSAGAGASLITRGFTQGGAYTIAVDADTTIPNTFNLNVSGVIAPGGSCESPLFATGVLRCSTGFTCAGAVGARTCIVGQCLDGLDNNTDGKTDFPFDPGCTSFADPIEDTVCPGPSCPICADGVDNDNDGATDYPMDTSCFSASAGNEACAQSEPVDLITTMVTFGNTAPVVNDYQPTCGSTTTHTAPDLAYQLDLPTMATLQLNVIGDPTGIDTAHSLLNSTCGGTPIACSDPPLMTRTNVPAGTYYVVVDGWGTGFGAFALETTGTIAAGGSCEGELFRDGAFACVGGTACAGAAGSRTCQTALCNDGMDNDGDTKMDFPADPGCTSTSDDAETDDCSPTIGLTCPACSNGIDDDTDTTIDFPMDTRCVSPSFFAENFCLAEANIGGEITSFNTFGTMAGMANNFSQSCQTTTGNDVSYALRLPVPVTSLVIDTIGSTATDAIVSLHNITCTMQLGCDDDSAPGLDNGAMLTVANVTAGDYAIQVDGFGSSNNLAFVLHVRGTVASGTACTSLLFASGVLVCPTGTTCTSGTCQ